MKLRLISFGLLAALILPSCGGSNQGQTEEVVKEVVAMTVTKTDATLEKVYPATIKGTEDVSIRPRVDGFVETIFVDEGSVVRAGAPLFKINSPATEEALRVADAAVNSAKASLKTAELNVDKLKPLVAEQIISDVQLRTAENAKTEAEARLFQAEAGLTNARAARGWATVTSPVNGVVGRIEFRKGSLVGPSSELTTVANISDVYAYFSMNEKELLEFLSTTPGKTQAEKIKNAKEVSLILLDRTVYEKKGKIETISGVVNTITGSINCRAKFNNAGGVLRSGSSGNVVLSNVVSDVFIVPQKATFAQQDKVILYKIVDGVATQTVVEALAMPNGQDYAVVGGLSEGDVIVADGINSIANGDKVSVK